MARGHVGRRGGQEKEATFSRAGSASAASQPCPGVVHLAPLRDKVREALQDTPASPPFSHGSSEKNQVLEEKGYLPEALALIIVTQLLLPNCQLCHLAQASRAKGK